MSIKINAEFGIFEKSLTFLFIVFIVLFFGKIFINQSAHSSHVISYTEKCEQKGGVVFTDHQRSFNRAHCFDPAVFITID